MRLVLALPAVVWLGLTPPPARAAEPPAAVLSLRLPHAPGPEQPAPVAGWTETLTAPRPLRLHFLRLDLRDPRLEPCVLLGADPDGTGPAEATLTDPRQLAGRASGVLAAVNANAFAHLAAATPAERRRGWYAGKAVDIQGLAAAAGTLRSPAQDHRIPFWFDAAGHPHLGTAAGDPPVHHGVADWGALLVTGGKVVAKTDAALHPRTLAGFDAAGRWWWLVVVDGRRRGVSEGMSLAEAAALMRARGCTEAVNLDGGGSSILLQQTSADPALTVINQPSDGRPRPIPVMLGVRRKPVPGAVP